MYKIVIVEDELVAAEYLKRLLLVNGFSVIAIIDSGVEALQKIPSLAPDIVLMDVMLKDAISGCEVALQLRYKAPDVAIVFLTAYDEKEMLDYAVASNTYGYMLKPYEESRIVNSLKIIVSLIEKERKERQDSVTSIVQITETLTFDLKQKRLFQNDKEVPIGTKPLALLDALCKHPNVTVSSEELSISIWGEAKDVAMLRTQISRLKKSLNADVIENVKGLGYRIVCKR